MSIKGCTYLHCSSVQERLALRFSKPYAPISRISVYVRPERSDNLLVYNLLFVKLLFVKVIQLVEWNRSEVTYGTGEGNVAIGVDLYSESKQA